MLTRANRLLKFQEVYREGRVARGRYMALRYKKKSESSTRIGFAVARLVRRKVQKNRLRRRMRSICRRHMKEIKDNMDIVVSIFSTATEASFEELEKDFSRVVRQAGLVKEEPQEKT